MFSKLSIPWKLICASYCRLSNELKNGTGNLESQAVFLVTGHNSQNIDLIRNCLVYLDLNAIFEFLGQFTIRYIYYFFQKGVDNFKIEAQNMLIFG